MPGRQGVLRRCRLLAGAAPWGAARARPVRISLARRVGRRLRRAGTVRRRAVQGRNVIAFD